ncbi:hypothetical protein RhiirA5_497495 [Rhizophagus irregularis]|uniref:Uncharacterized protein n=1 Tax=Rhizophagus irregularis TaxID=588596 RepID=A0A2I1F5B2_9GLOM|nr:hypothetical protein RhiirA5_497495 [Rhizophagus irregularis]PKC70746.1 hypothetical protein RhiirA1_532496 [Rhizophagus irregularis]PKY29550.1 hypothetical protein RhiirB3_530563 [Rhizophagus irregularis]
MFILTQVFKDELDNSNNETNNEENKDSIIEEQVIPLSTNQINDVSGISEVNQLEATDSLNYFELIEIVNIEYVTKGGLSKIFKGMWVKGPRLKYNPTERIWKNIPNAAIVLKELDNQENF